MNISRCAKLTTQLPRCTIALTFPKHLRQSTSLKSGPGGENFSGREVDKISRSPNEFHLACGRSSSFVVLGLCLSLDLQLWLVSLGLPLWEFVSLGPVAFLDFFLLLLLASILFEPIYSLILLLRCWPTLRVLLLLDLTSSFFLYLFVSLLVTKLSARLLVTTLSELASLLLFRPVLYPPPPTTFHKWGEEYVFGFGLEPFCVFRIFTRLGSGLSVISQHFQRRMGWRYSFYQSRSCFVFAAGKEAAFGTDLGSRDALLTFAFSPSRLDGLSTTHFAVSNKMGRMILPVVSWGDYYIMHRASRNVFIWLIQFHSFRKSRSSCWRGALLAVIMECWVTMAELISTGSKAFQCK